MIITTTNSTTTTTTTTTTVHSMHESHTVSSGPWEHPPPPSMKGCNESGCVLHCVCVPPEIKQPRDINNSASFLCSSTRCETIKHANHTEWSDTTRYIGLARVTLISPCHTKHFITMCTVVSGVVFKLGGNALW